MSTITYFRWIAPDGTTYVGFATGNRGSSVKNGTVLRKLEFMDEVYAVVADWRAGSLVALDSEPVPQITEAPSASLTDLADGMAALGTQQINLQTRKARKDAAKRF